MEESETIYSSKARDGYIDADKSRLFDRIRRSLQLRVFSRAVSNREAVVLDVGCGGGRFLELLYVDGYRNIYGLEPDIALLDVALSDFPFLTGRITSGEATKLPYDSESYDCVYFFNVLHHLRGSQDYEQALSESFRVLKPNGCLVFVEPCNKLLYTIKRCIFRILAPFSRFATNIYNMMITEKDVMGLFIDSNASIRTCLKDLGFVVEYNRKHFHQWAYIARKNG